MMAMVPEFKPSAAHAASNGASAGFHSRALGLPGSGARPAAFRVRMSLRRFGMGLGRMAAVDDRVGPLKAALEVPPVGLELERGRLDAARIGDHAVGGGDCVGLDAKRADHAARCSWLSELTSDRNSARVSA